MMRIRIFPVLSAPKAVIGCDKNPEMLAQAAQEAAKNCLRFMLQQPQPDIIFSLFIMDLSRALIIHLWMAREYPFRSKAVNES